MDKENHDELVGLLEDSISYFCNQNRISGELAWLIVQCYATAKTEQFKGNLK